MSEVDNDLILFLHKMLMSNIDDNIAGRHRKAGEYVGVGKYIAPIPEQIESMIDSLLLDYSSNTKDYFLEKISRFHLEFEHIHPFYYSAFTQYRNSNKKKTGTMDRVLTLALRESFNKRIAYLRGGKIITLSDYAKKKNLQFNKMFVNYVKF